MGQPDGSGRYGSLKHLLQAVGKHTGLSIDSKGQLSKLRWPLSTVLPGAVRITALQMTTNGMLIVWTSRLLLLSRLSSRGFPFPTFDAKGD